MNILNKVANLDREVKLLKTKQFSGSSNVPEPFNYPINITQNFSRAYANGASVIKFVSNGETAPVISFIGSISVNGENAVNRYDPSRYGSGKPFVGISYDIGLGAVRFSYIKGQWTGVNEYTAFVTISWVEGRGNTGSTIIQGTLVTSSEGKMEIANEVY